MSRKCLNHSATMSPNASLANARAEGSVTPKANQNSVCLLLNRGPQSKPRFICLLWGERRYELPYTLWVPKINDLFILGERRHESSAGSPKIFDLLGCFSTMKLRHRSIRPHCRTRAISFAQSRYRTRRLRSPITSQPYIPLRWQRYWH